HGAMQISPEQGQFMALLIELLNAKKTLEIGVFTGYSALSVALALPKNGRLVGCEINVEWANMAQRYGRLLGVENKIDLRLGPALTTLANLLAQGEENSFDFVFIDADKENNENYYEAALKLLRTGGICAIDNVLWHGEVADPEIQDATTICIRE